MKKLITVLLTLSLLLSCLLPVTAAESGFPPKTDSGELTLGNTEVAQEEKLSAEEILQGAFAEEQSAARSLLEPTSTPVSQQIETTGYAADELVTFIVVLDTLPLLEAGFSAEEISKATKAVSDYGLTQTKAIQSAKTGLTAAFGREKGFRLGYSYTVATTGLSVTTQYGNKAAIEAMDGVKKVYVAPTFSLPETVESLQPATGNSSTMIGADSLNSSGYTGLGMKIAILDTGLVLGHPSFQALPEDKLTESSMTREFVEEVWSELNASQTTLLCNAYHSSKVPFVFNYTTMTFDVSHATAGSDHGTHVAGTAAANQTADTTVVGVAPDAQVIVMQVFSSTGAAWDTIMAALEDCVRLDVDAANLSLGAAAGFSSADEEFDRVLGLFMQTDIEVLIASGNDTNNAYQNAFGLNMSLSGNPDIGLTGTPATYEGALSVASANNDGAKLLYFTAEGREIGFNDTATTSFTRFISNFQGQTLSFVAVPGLGEAADYEGLDVTGKVALVSRGTISFPEKQANAQAAGAIAVVIYDNVQGSMINMQINDGEGNIPAVFISKADGDYLAALGKGSFTVCEGDLKTFKQTQTLSDFSSWGVTPDLKLKPEITGVGGSIYSSTDPSISGSWYNYMSGTSMATPQIAGAMAVLLEYLKENYGYEEAELRRVAANLLMSTANPVMQGDSEYSPRWQGAGLADLLRATQSGAYLSDSDTSEGRPKAEFGDDDERTGVYTFDFELTNMDGDEKTYDLSASVLTETLYADAFIANDSYALGARVEFFGTVETEALKYDFNHDGKVDTADARVLLRHINGVELLSEEDPCNAYIDIDGSGTSNKADVDLLVGFCAGLETGVDFTAKVTVAEEGAVSSVTVGANETIKLTAVITLTDEDKAYLDASFENGMYIEGYVYLDGEVDLNMPFLGFYGDWSAAPIFDVEEDYYSLYPLSIYTYYSELGTNPYIRGGKSGDEYNAFSYGNPLAEIDVGLLRNVRDILFTVKNTETGEVYWTLDGYYLSKTYYSTSYGMIVPLYLMTEYGEIWDGKDQNGNKLPEGTKVTYLTEAWLDDGDDIMDDSFSFDMTLDSTAPQLLNADTLQDSLTVGEDGTVTLQLTMQDNHHIAALIFMADDGTIMGKYEVDNTPGEPITVDYNITGFGGNFTILVADYACNETEIEVLLDLGDATDAISKPAKLSADRIYGCETFDGAAIEGGWFSANKADLSDPRNETFDSVNRYYSGEFINGYVVAQRESDGAIVLLTPNSTYWRATVISEQQSYGDYEYGGFHVLYDMALDHATDTLYAVGWSYRGDYDGDGRDNGYNALFRFYSDQYGAGFQEVARIHGTEDGAELLTLGITTEGAVYGIDTNAKLYSVTPETVWNDEIGDWGDYVIPCTYIGTTDFVNETGYDGANVIQSMGYDHNTGTMYWFAHSQSYNGVYYENLNITYTVDLTTGACTEVGTYGPGGQTALFIPNELTSTVFTMGVDPNEFSVSPDTLYLPEGKSTRLNVIWKPWNAAPTEVTWTSSDETVATVDEHGTVTGISEGYATITASAEVYYCGWGYDENWNWVYTEEWTVVEHGCMVQVLKSNDELYGYIISDFGNASNDFTWVTYSDKNPRNISYVGESKLDGVDEDGNPIKVSAIWQGGTYYNGYVYTTVSEQWIEDDVIYSGTGLYRSTVTKGDDGIAVIGEPAFIGRAEDIQIGNIAFDYNTGRMYGVDLTYGGLLILDIETGKADRLGTFSGDIGGAAIAPAMCVTADGTIIISDMYGTLYTLDCDTLSTTNIGSLNTDTWFYGAMTYDYNTGNIYWNPCMNANGSGLYMVKMEYGRATIIDIGDVSTKAGVEQTVIFSIPESEPETQQIPVESIDILDDAVTGLEGGSYALTAQTTPLRPTVQAKTWSSDNEEVVTVDQFGVLTFAGVGTATVTVSITNKDEATYGGPFTDSISVTVLEAAGEFRAFLASDEGTYYYDFWLNGNDYDLTHTGVGESMISVYSLRSGTYYDGFFYGYNDKGQFLRINAVDPSDYKILGTVNLDTAKYQVTAMAMDYTTGTMYGLTLPSDYDYSTWSSEQHPGELVTVNMDNGQITAVAVLDFSTPVFALACDKNGQLYAAGGSMDYYATESKLYRLDKATGTLNEYATIPGSVYTGGTYYGTTQYNAQMTYDFGTDRLYLNASVDHPYYSTASGMFMIQLGETPTVTSLGGISLYTRAGSEIKKGNVYLGLLAFIPETEELPVGKVNGILSDKSSVRMAVGSTLQLQAQVRPSNAADQSLTWVSSDETVATVDQNGLVTSLKEGVLTVTATSVESPSVSMAYTISVVNLQGPQSVAYTVSANKDAIVSFNPELPGATTQVVGPLSGGKNVVGLDMGEDGMYYLIYDEASYGTYLYFYDFITQQSNLLGQLYTFTTPSDMAFDPVNRLIYVTGGFYLWQYQLDTLDPAGFNYYSGYKDITSYDYAYPDMTAVSCHEGKVYVLGKTNNGATLYEADKYMTFTTLLTGIPLNAFAGKSQMAYDSYRAVFYIMDAADVLYSFDLEGNVTVIDSLASGYDMNGIAVKPAETDAAP